MDQTLTDWTYELNKRQKGYNRIAGIDEAGRGPLAGPVVAAAVILNSDYPIDGITDSKKLSSKKRDLLFEVINKQALSVGVGIVESPEIDKINILRAALRAMRLAVDALSIPPDYLLIDGSHPIESHFPQENIIKGDQLSISIGAASIIAKVTRDRLMTQYNQIYPLYGFSKHKGYGTVEHRKAIQKYGPCPIHRRSFKGVKEYCLSDSLKST